MRIVQVSTLYPPEFFSGGTLAPHQIARGLQARGHEVSVFAGSCVYGEPAMLEKTWTYEGVRVHAINVASGYAQGESNHRNASVAERFERYLAHVRPEIVHFHCIQALGADMLAVPRAYGAATVLTMHDGWFVCPRQFMFIGSPRMQMCPLKVDPAVCDCTPRYDYVGRRRFLDAALEPVDRILAVSQPFADVLRENGVAADKLVVCENGLSPASPLPRTPSSRVRFGYLAGPDDWKGPRTVAAATKLVDRDVSIDVYGIDAERWEDLEGRGPDHRVRLKPRFMPADLPRIMADLDVVIVASLGIETFSLLTREAMQHGVPVISSRCLGPEAAVRDGENGLLYERGDAAGLAAAMQRVADDPALLSRISAGAKATPVRTMDEQVHQIEGLYRDLVRDRTRPAEQGRLPRSVLFVAGMEGAPFRYRVSDLVEQLEALGVRATARFQHDQEALSLAGEHEIVVLNRIAWDGYVERIVRRARAAGAVLVFGVDDLIFEPRLDIPALAGLPRDVARSYRRGLRLFRRTLNACDAFLGSTQALADVARAAGKPVFIHPNTLGRELQTMSEAARQRASSERAAGPSSAVRLGYFSGSLAHDLDFAVAADALARVLAARKDAHLVLGGHLRVPESLEAFADRIERVPFVSWRELPDVLARIDVNLAPLQTPSIFNDAKSALKWFEAAVVGVPTIASPTATFREAIRHGENGMLADTADDWEASILALIDDGSLRVRLAEAARADALARYTSDTATPLLAATMRDLARLASGPLRALPPVTEAELERIRGKGIGIGQAALEPRGALEGPAQLTTTSVTPALSGAISANQPVAVPDGILFRVDFMVGTYGRVHRHDLVLRVLDLGTGDLLARSMVPAEHACDNAWLAFELSEDVPTRAGHQLLLVLEAPSTRKGEGLSLYCQHIGWPSGAGWCGAVIGINLAYRSWFRPAGAVADRLAARAEPGAAGQAAELAERAERRSRELERRLALAEQRLALGLRRPRGVEAILRRTRLAKALEVFLEFKDAPGDSFPARSVRKALSLFVKDGDDQEVARLMERVRSAAPYRVGRKVYRSMRRR